MTASLQLHRTIHALPVRDLAAAADMYRDPVGFGVPQCLAVLARDESVVHLWESSDENWRER